MSKIRNTYLKRKYGITLEQYNSILVKQGGGCAICKKTPQQEGRSLAVDHDHKTMEIFGLLCMFCNHRLVGRIRNPFLFQEAAIYLQEGTGWFVPKKKKKKRKKRVYRRRTIQKPK